MNPTTAFAAALLAPLFAAAASAAPTLTVGTASGQAGTTVSLPIAFDPAPSTVSGIQFNLTLPPSLSSGPVTAGTIVTNAGKSISTSKRGGTWTFIIFGLNQDAIAAGGLLTAQLSIAPGTAAGSLAIAISSISFSDPNGNPIAGSGTAGSVAVVPPAPAITSANSASGQVGAAFSYQITATNSPTSFGASGLPAGLSINTATGLISGTPSAAGTSNVTLSAANAGGTGTLSLTLNVLPAAPVVNSSTAAVGRVGVAFSYQITATNSPTSFGASGLPAGLSINTATGLISGTPSAAGTSSVTLSATNAGGTGTRTLSLTVLPQPPVVTSTGAAAGQVGAAFTYQIAATNSPTSFGAGGLPAGLSINTATGLISGTPSAAGTSNVTLSATNAGGTGTKTLTLTVNPPAPVITSASSASGQVGAAFSYQIAATNNPSSFGASGLPAGLSINTGTGLISGTPSAAGTSNATLSATNAGGTGTLSLTITIVPPAPVITSAGTATGQVGAAFTYQIAATNSPTSFGASGLPAGISINTGTGLISGTPSAAGTSTVALSATNAGGTGTRTLTLTVNPPAPVINSASSATGQVGAAFTYQITASNAPTSFGATGLPAGLSINAGTGLISGTPSAAGASSVALSATNAGGTGTLTLSLTIHPPAPVITSAGSASGKVGSAFSYQITATNNPTSFGASGLPAGLSINTVSGLISGTPSAAGASTVSLSASNSGGSGTASLALNILSPCDLNGDGSTNAVDLQLEVNQALGIAACTGDFNGDGQCNIVDIQRTVNAILLGACLLGP